MVFLIDLIHIFPKSREIGWAANLGIVVAKRFKSPLLAACFEMLSRKVSILVERIKLEFVHTNMTIENMSKILINSIVSKINRVDIATPES